MKTSLKKLKGFTLIEILVALAVLVILAGLLANALHRTIRTTEVLRDRSSRLEQLQFAFLILSRDLEQAVDRPILNASGSEQLSLMGGSSELTLTRAGVANPDYVALQSIFRRARYYFSDNGLWRETWDALDLPPQAISHKRKLISNVQNCEFIYYDQQLKPQKSWPASQVETQSLENKSLKDENNKPDNNAKNNTIQNSMSSQLPVAIRINLNLGNLGKMSQLYIIHELPSQIQANNKTRAST